MAWRAGRQRLSACASPFAAAQPPSPLSTPGPHTAAVMTTRAPGAPCPPPTTYHAPLAPRPGRPTPHHATRPTPPPPPCLSPAERESAAHLRGHAAVYGARVKLRQVAVQQRQPLDGVVVAVEPEPGGGRTRRGSAREVRAVVVGWLANKMSGGERAGEHAARGDDRWGGGQQGQRDGQGVCGGGQPPPGLHACVRACVCTRAPCVCRVVVLCVEVLELLEGEVRNLLRVAAAVEAVRVVREQ